MRRAASRAFHPAQASTAARASATSVVPTVALASASMYADTIFVCAWIGEGDAGQCVARLRRRRPGQGPADVRAEFLQAILDGHLPAPPIAGTLSFWLTEIGDGVAVFEGEPGPHLVSARDRARRLGHDPDRQRGRLRAHTLLPPDASYATIETKANFSDRSPKTLVGCAPKDAPLAAGAASSPAKHGSSTPGASSRTGPRPSWC